MVVHHEYALGAQQPRRRRGHQSDRARAEDRDGRSLADRCVDGCHVARGQDVGQEEHLLVRQARVGDDERADVGLGNTHEFGLSARNAAIQVAVSEQRGPGLGVFLVDDGAAPGVGGLAGREQLQVAVEALPARDGERDHHAVALLHAQHGGPHLLDDAHEFVAEDVAVLHHRDLAAVDVQVGTADGGCRDAQDDVVRVDDLRIGDGLDPYILRAVVGEGFHQGLRWSIRGRGPPPRLVSARPVPRPCTQWWSGTSVACPRAIDPRSSPPCRLHPRPDAVRSAPALSNAMARTTPRC